MCESERFNPFTFKFKFIIHLKKLNMYILFLMAQSKMFFVDFFFNKNFVMFNTNDK